MRSVIPFLVLAMSACDATPPSDDGREAVTDPTADLLFLREEEKLARDVYLTMFETWGLQIHDNISQSEQRHMDSVVPLLDARGLTDPVNPDTRGVFVDPLLQQMYTDLVAQGIQSEVDALLVGATIEDFDLLDLQRLIDDTDDADIDATAANLLCGSENHMRAFHQQLAQRGVSYTAQYIDQGSLDAVLTTSQRSCGTGSQ